MPADACDHSITVPKWPSGGSDVAQIHRQKMYKATRSMYRLPGPTFYLPLWDCVVLVMEASGQPNFLTLQKAESCRTFGTAG